MTDQLLAHSMFTIERRLEAPPAAAFRAWSDEAAKARWFGATDTWKETRRDFDFRVGGTERLAGEWKSGVTTEFVALYRDIIENERIVYVYDMHVNGEKISVSLATIEISPDGDGALMKVTEQGSYFVGGEGANASRERGTIALIDRLVASVDATARER